MELDARLGALAQMIEPCETVADVGTDHGFLGAYLLEQNRCRRVQFCDISEFSLQKARRLIEEMGLGQRADFSVGDGAMAIQYPAQQVVIAGMGGVTIAGIVERGTEKLKDSALIMQPNVAAPYLRAELLRLGFCVEREALARAGGRWYVIIRARRGQAVYDEKELLAGPDLLRRRDVLLPGYAEFRIRVAKKALQGARQGNEEKAAAFEREIQLWEEIVQWLQK